MTVGVDTFVTLDAADEYVEAHYASASSDALRWAGLYERDKTVYLTAACREISALPFPRMYDTPPAAFAEAQCVLAVWLSDTQKQNDNNARTELIGQGVTSFSLGDLSETYGSVRTGDNPALSCVKCRRLLMPYLSGGFEIC